MSRVLAAVFALVVLTTAPAVAQPSPNQIRGHAKVIQTNSETNLYKAASRDRAGQPPGAIAGDEIPTNTVLVEVSRPKGNGCSRWVEVKNTTDLQTTARTDPGASTVFFCDVGARAEQYDSTPYYNPNELYDRPQGRLNADSTALLLPKAPQLSASLWESLQDDLREQRVSLQVTSVTDTGANLIDEPREAEVEKESLLRIPLDRKPQGNQLRIAWGGSNVVTPPEETAAQLVALVDENSEGEANTGSGSTSQGDAQAAGGLEMVALISAFLGGFLVLIVVAIAARFGYAPRWLAGEQRTGLDEDKLRDIANKLEHRRGQVEAGEEEEGHILPENAELGEVCANLIKAVNALDNAYQTALKKRPRLADDTSEQDSSGNEGDSSDEPEDDGEKGESDEPINLDDLKKGIVEELENHLDGFSDRVQNTIVEKLGELKPLDEQRARELVESIPKNVVAEFNRDAEGNGGAKPTTRMVEVVERLATETAAMKTMLRQALDRRKETPMRQVEEQTETDGVPSADDADEKEEEGVGENIDERELSPDDAAQEVDNEEVDNEKPADRVEDGSEEHDQASSQPEAANTAPEGGLTTQQRETAETLDEHAEDAVEEEVVEEAPAVKKPSEEFQTIRKRAENLASSPEALLPKYRDKAEDIENIARRICEALNRKVKEADEDLNNPLDAAEACADVFRKTWHPDRRLSRNVFEYVTTKHSWQFTHEEEARDPMTCEKAVQQYGAWVETRCQELRSFHSGQTVLLSPEIAWRENEDKAYRTLREDQIWVRL